MSKAVTGSVAVVAIGAPRLEASICQRGPCGVFVTPVVGRVEGSANAFESNRPVSKVGGKWKVLMNCPVREVSGLRPALEAARGATD